MWGQMQFELLVAWSHLRSRRQDVGVSLIAVLSVLGITLGVQMLIIVLAVMQGFEGDLRDKILGFNAHVVLLSYEGNVPDPAAALKISAHACHATNIQLYGEPARGWSYDVFPANVKLTDVDGKILRSSEFDDSDSFKAALLDVIPLKNR